MNIISFDTNKRNTTIELSSTEARQIKNLLYLSVEENMESNKELYKDFFILVELLTSKRLDSWAVEYYNSIGFDKSEEEEEESKEEKG